MKMNEIALIQNKTPYLYAYELQGYILGDSSDKPETGGDVIHFLRIGIATETGLYILGYIIPTADQMTDVHMAMELINSFRILR